jgi:hypothetical protein
LINNLKKIFSYLKYLTPILISKHSFDFDTKAFINSLRLNTQSAFDDEKQLLRDKKIGRKNDSNSDCLVLYEYDRTFVLKNNKISDDSSFANATTVMIFSKSKNKVFHRINYPGLIGSALVLGILFGLFASIFVGEDNLLMILSFISLYIFFNYQFYQDYKEQNEFIDKIIKMGKKEI